MEAESPTDDPLLTDKRLKEKKQKLHETLSRVIRHFEKEDPKRAQDIRAMVVDSEHQRREVSKVYSSYRAVRSQYDVSDSPVPDGPVLGESSGTEIVAPSDIPMPSALGPGEKQSETDLPSDVPPGMVPPVPPPVIFPQVIIVGSTHPAKSVQFADIEETNVNDLSSEGPETSDEDDDMSDQEEEEQALKTEGRPQRSKGQLVPPGPPAGPPPGLPMFSAYPPPSLFNQAPPSSSSWKIWSSPMKRG